VPAQHVLRGMGLYRRILVTSSLLIFTCGRASAQDEFSHIRLKIGDTVYVTTSGEGELKGIVANLSASMLKVDGHEFSPAPNLKIEREGDPVWDGALIGAGIASLASLFVYPHSKDRVGVSLVAAGVGAFWGALVDFSIKGRTVVYKFGSRQASIEIGLRRGAASRGSSTVTVAAR